MKLDHDLVRDIVLGIERNWPPRYADYILNQEKAIPREVFGPLLASTEPQTLLETVVVLADGGYVSGHLDQNLESGDFYLTGLSWRGHEFANNVRDEGVWNRTKLKATEIAQSVSVSVLSDVAKRLLMGGLSD